jgi:hypothetical protein
MNTLDAVKYVPLNITQYAGAINSASLNIQNAHHVTLLCQFLADVDGNGRLSITSHTAADGDTTTLTHYTGYVTGADVGAVAADTFAATAVTVDSGQNYVTLTEATFEKRLLVIELPVGAINPDHKWIRVKFSADATAGSCIVIAVVQPRFKQKDIPTMVKLA